MWSSPLFWMVFAIALFWALGAYNRLMRLRSAVVQAFGGFDAHMVRQVALLGEFDAAHASPAGAREAEAAHSEIAALQGATTQLCASLALARARPLQKDAVAGLAAAREVLHASWTGAMQRLHPDPAAVASPAGDTAGTEQGATAGDGPSDAAGGSPHATAMAPMASVWQVRWKEHSQQNEQAVRVFNDAVQQYNAAVAQFPANLLAWLFGFKAARGL